MARDSISTASCWFKPFIGKLHFMKCAVCWLCLFLHCSSLISNAQDTSLANKQAELNLLRDMLRIPNDAQYPNDITANIEWLEQQLQKRGFKVTLFESARRPFVFASKLIDAQLPTVLFYMHFDGQPVTHSEWMGGAAYQPVLRKKTDQGWEPVTREAALNGLDPEWRLFARSASDDKGPIAMWLAALDRLSHAQKKPAYNLKLILDSEEEKGSPNLAKMVQVHRNELMADRLVILDGPRHTSNEPTLIFGCRGVAQLNLEIFGPANDLHSGHYGNYAPNPALALANLLAGMKDSLGRVTIPGFYDGIHISPERRALLQAVPDKKAFINRQIGIAQEINPELSYQEGLQYPSLNILYLYAGKPEAGTRNIVPASAAAALDIRLVPETDPKALEALLRNYLRAQGYLVLDHRAPTAAERSRYPKILSFSWEVSSLAFVTEPDSPAGIWISRIVHNYFRKQPVSIRMSGGTVPIAPFIKALNIPAILLPTVNPDNNQHTSNENLRLGNYFEGIDCITLLLQESF